MKKAITAVALIGVSVATGAAAALVPDMLQESSEPAGRTSERHVSATATRPAFMPCDNQDTWETALRVRPKTCSVYSGTNGVGASSMAEGAHVVSLRWKSWGGKKAKATGQIKGQKVGDPDRPATIVLKGESCDEFVVYTTMTMVTDEGAYPIRLDGDCDHLSASSSSESVQAADDNSADDAKAAAEEVERVREENRRRHLEWKQAEYQRYIDGCRASNSDLLDAAQFCADKYAYHEGSPESGRR